MKLGLVGLPNVGKSTLFNAITATGANSTAIATAANYPFCTIEPNHGVVAVPDPRLAELANLYHPQKVTPASVEFLDIAGLVRGASKGEGLGNQFLSHIREVDAVLHVVRCFDDDEIIHVEGNADPVRDVEIIDLELTMADLEWCEKRRDKAQKMAKGQKSYLAEVAFLDRLCAHLDGGKPARTFQPQTEDEREIYESCSLLSGKPVLYCANMREDEIANADHPHLIALTAIAEAEGNEVFPVSAKIEQELAEMDADERAVFLEELGLAESGLDRLIRKSYHLLGLMSFLTAGEPEVRAWTIPQGTPAPRAAGKIHSDIERGFIRAEVIDCAVLIAEGSLSSARAKGLVRSEGKEYVMQDGDVVLFRFNV